MAGEYSQRSRESGSQTAAGYEVAVVIPCLNEAETIGGCVSKAIDTLGSLGIRGEVIVVDSGSSDGSATTAERCGARVVREARRGYGSALMRGIEEAQSPLIIMADADGSHDLAEIGPFVHQLKAGAGLVMGARRKEFINLKPAHGTTQATSSLAEKSRSVEQD